MKTSTWDLIWELLDIAWVIACYVLALYAFYHNAYAETAMWLGWLILSKVQKINRNTR